MYGGNGGGKHISRNGFVLALNIPYLPQQDSSAAPHPHPHIPTTFFLVVETQQGSAIKQCSEATKPVRNLRPTIESSVFRRKSQSSRGRQSQVKNEHNKVGLISSLLHTAETSHTAK